MPPRTTHAELPTADGQLGVQLARFAAELGPARFADYLSRLGPSQRARAERAGGMLTAAGWRADPSTFTAHLDGDEWTRWPYIDLLGKKFAEAFRGIDPHQIWNLPSQYGKTTSLMRGVGWALDMDPRLRIMYVSYDADKAVEEGGLLRDWLEAHAGELRVRLRPDRRARGMWRTTEGGGLYCVGINGAITGFPADAVLADDLIKGWQAAHSEAQRGFAMHVYQSQIRMRLQSEWCPIIVAGTRWHEEDPSGQLMQLGETNPDADTWTVIRLPAIAEPADPNAADALLRLPDPLGRAPGELLGRFSEREVRARHAVLGEYLTAAMEQQRPAPEEGGDVKRAWWQWADAPPPRFDDALTSWDMKLKDKSSGDYVVGQAWGRTGADYWWLDQLRGQYNLVETKTAIMLMAVRHPEINRHVVENTGNGPEVMAELRRKQPNYTVSDEVRSKLGMTDDERTRVEALFRRGLSGIVPENVKKDKRVRLRAITPLIEAGNVHLLLGRPEADALVNETAAFPNGAHDDQVDALSQALKRLSGAPATVKSGAGKQLPKTRTSSRASPEPGVPARARSQRSRVIGARGRAPVRAPATTRK